MRSILAGMAAAVLLTGCGTALAQPGAGHSGRQPRTAAVVTGTRAQAQAYVRHAMAELSLPAGTKPAHLKSLPGIMRALAPSGTGWVGGSRILIVPGQPEAVLQRISGHAPFNEPGGYTATPVLSSTMLPAPEPGLDAAILELAVQAYSRTTTLVGAYAFAAWLPYRTAAEHLNPASFRSVTIVKDQINDGKQSTESHTFTSTALIGRFASVLNADVPAPPSAQGELLGCVPGGITYTLRFTARAERGPSVTASAFCGTIAISVNGKPQPSLWDTNGGLEKIASAVSGPGAGPPSARSGRPA
jgi:hypothetical protein